jgi:hypothetical protein
VAKLLTGVRHRGVGLDHELVRTEYASGQYTQSQLGRRHNVTRSGIESILVKGDETPLARIKRQSKEKAAV